MDVFKKLVRDVGMLDDQMFDHLMEQYVKADLIDELGDVLWYLNKLCTFLDITVLELMVLNTVKLHERWGIPNDAVWPFSGITFEQAKGDVELIPF